MGLVLLVNDLMDDYTPSWKGKLAKAFDSFREQLMLSTARRFDDDPGEYWLKYGQWARSNSDRAETIARRRAFFVTKMHEFLEPVLKDSTRVFGNIERQIIYARDGKKCQAIGCGSEVAWSDAEVHHVLPHHHGGKTDLANGALVHKDCHPKGAKAVQDFQASWVSKQAQPDETNA